MPFWRKDDFDPTRPTLGMRRLNLLPCCMAGPGLARCTPTICNSTGLGFQEASDCRCQCNMFPSFSLKKSRAGWEGHMSDNEQLFCFSHSVGRILACQTHLGACPDMGPVSKALPNFRRGGHSTGHPTGTTVTLQLSNSLLLEGAGNEAAPSQHRASLSRRLRRHNAPRPLCEDLTLTRVLNLGMLRRMPTGTALMRPQSG